uniref:ISP1 C-terminal domain-containing protein n=1 Tax=Alexandrium monilatum TaxID=311494 RepID=A0A7S4QPR8_9DINO
MTWSLTSCCCTPTPAEAPKKVRRAQSSYQRSSEAAKAGREHQAGERDQDGAVGRRPSETIQLPAGPRRTCSASSDARAPAAANWLLRDDLKLSPADQDGETESLRSTRSAKSLRSQGTSASINSESAHDPVSAKSLRSQGTSSSIGSEFIQERMMQRESSSMGRSMKAFVRGMVRGQQISVIAPDGQLCTCNCTMDKRLRYFVIELKGSQRRIPMSSITEVFQGREPEDIDTPLSERCSTLMLERGDCISFHFPDVESREHFAMCLQILVDGQQ